jgi:hypothetical protein
VRIRDKLRTGSFWAVLDQMLVSAGNFATTLVLSRCLTPSEFGTFALLTSVCLVANGFHSNLIVSPLMVLGAAESGKKERTCPAAAIGLTSLLFPVWICAILIASLSLHRIASGVLAALSVLAWQYQETTRRSLFAAFRQRDALWGDLISYPGQAVVLWLAMRARSGNLNSAFVVIGATSLVAALLQGGQIGMGRISWKRCALRGGEFWKISRWLLLSSLTGMVAAPWMPWLLNWLHGRSAAASFQAVMAVLNLTNPLVLSIPSIVIPAVSAMLARPDSNPRYLKAAIRYIAQFEILLAPLLLGMLVWPRWVLSLFFGAHSVYCHETASLRIAVLTCVLNVPLQVFQGVLTGKGKTRNVAILQGAGALTGLLGAPLLVFYAGVPGSMLAESVSRAVKSFCGMQSLVRLDRKERGPSPFQFRELGHVEN